MIKGARVETVEGAAHAAYWEKPDEVNELLIKHLAG
jgi:pimeloyl-ACP methyl ester carboxylesterase